MSRLFEVKVVAVSTNLDIDFDEVIGKEATFSLEGLGLAGSSNSGSGEALPPQSIR